MVLEFTKLNGAGNDFVLIDDRAQKTDLSREQVARICDRHRGVGADGLILLVPCASGGADWAWRFYNSDGSTGEMCGNGARCFAQFARRLGAITGDFSFETGAGIITARFEGETVTVNLTPPRDLQLDEELVTTGGKIVVHYINTGVPHAVLFVPDADQAMVERLGREIRWHPRFAPKGTNVNFAQLLGPSRIRVRTFERGVEGETLACGTGLTASALIASRLHGFASPVTVQVQSGDQLQVRFSATETGFENVLLSGPADCVFEGRINI
jgi:diaminopimelate epimerase